MKHGLKSLLFSLSLCLITSHSIAQGSPSTLDSLKHFAKNCYTFSQLYPLEKVYLHLDNSSYYQSETIWFKAYIVRASDTHMSSDSKILYVELLTDKGEIAQRKKLKIENGQCHGAFSLDQEARTGFYEIRAYTRAMLNFGEDNIFSRVIPIYKRPLIDGDYSEKEISNRHSYLLKNYRSSAKEKKNITRSFDVTFYPEGGHLALGLTNRVAFKAKDNSGKNIAVTGHIRDANGEIIGQFASAHQGMGSFELEVKGDETIVINYEGKTQDFQLPTARSNSYTMRVNNLNTKLLSVTISKSPGLAAETLGLMVNCRNKAVLFNVIDVAHGSLQIPIKKAELPRGVNSLTLFRANGAILAERLFFVNHPKKVILDIASESKYYTPLQQVNIAIAAHDTQGQDVASNLSMAIKDASSSGTSAYAEDIRTHLLLSSDLRGYIHQPGYYFASNDIEHRYALDLLMMTQGWRCYTWEQRAGMKAIDIQHPIEENLMIKGQVMKPILDAPMQDTRIKYRLSKTGKASQNAYGDTDNNGQFTFLLNDSLKLYGQWDLTLSVPREGSKAKRNRILIDRQFSPKPQAYNYEETLDHDTLMRFASHEVHEEERHSVEDIQLINEYKLIRYKSELTQANITYNVEKEINDLADQGIYFASTVGGYLEDKDPNFTYSQTDSIDSYHYMDKTVMFVHHYTKDIYNRHTRIADISIEAVENIALYLDQHSWEHLASKNYFKDAPIQELLDPDSSNKFVVILVRTKADKSYKEVPKGMRLTYFNGYANQKEFAEVVLHQPIIGEIDHRRTLYWDPNVKLDEAGKATIEFYNNSSCEHLLIDVQGITDHGEPVSQHEP